jgi:threonine/homoserine/homoserine lactone efflux protein
MTDPSFLLAPSFAFMVLVGAPGPATLAVTAMAMSQGRRAALVFAAGLSLGLAMWGLVAAVGLGAAMLAWAPALFAFRLAGGAFLLWLAWNSVRSALAPAPASRDAAGIAPTAMFRRGLLLNMLNPKAVLAWGAVIALGLPEAERAAGYAAMLGLCAAIGTSIYVCYALTFSLPSIRAGYARFRRWVEAACAAVFGLVGVRLLTWRPEAL